MGRVKRYHVGDAGLVEGDALGRLSVVLAADFDRVLAEREALQLQLNQRDEANHDLEQRRHAEQQACQAAERRVAELQSELTKARELLADVAKKPWMYDVLGSVREYLGQSAPAAKDGE